jgi:xanthine dehydrogenase accessory factor
VRDVIDELQAWWEQGRPVGVATVVATWLSAPRQAGAAMAVGPDGTVVGSVSGGCVEGDVYEVALAVRESDVAQLRRYGVSDDDAVSVGLTCGGVIDVFVEQISRAAFPEFGSVADDVRAGRPVAVATLISGDEARLGRRVVVRPDGMTGSLGGDRIDDERLKRLRERGMTEEQLARLHAPIGLDVGARTPEETAISVAAEIIAARWGGSGVRLSDTVGPIHHELNSPLR